MTHYDSTIKIAIAIPTINSSAYIFNSLFRISKEIDNLNKHYSVMLIVCVNGTNDNHKTVNEVNRFMKNNRFNFKTILIENEVGGKNKAINTLAQYACQQGIDIINFLDDDVVIKENSLLNNIRALIISEKESNKITLVGAHFRSIDRDLSFFIKNENNLWNALKNWFWHNVFRVAFDSGYDYPAFCSGQCMGLYLKYLPELPDDNTGITDDTFLSNYAAMHGKIIKPLESEVYFNISTLPSEWLKQQVRIYIGVVKARDFFTGKEKFIEELNFWPYCHIKHCRIKTTKMSIRRRLFYVIFLKYSNLVSEVAEQSSAWDWGTATSTKINFDKV